MLEVTHSDPILTFVFATIALIPLAKLIGDSTEHLATHYGTSTASLLNVTFGNAAEIIIFNSCFICRISNSSKGIHYRLYYRQFTIDFWIKSFCRRTKAERTIFQ